jgi:hypothetical protein
LSLSLSGSFLVIRAAIAGAAHVERASLIVRTTAVMLRGKADGADGGDVSVLGL